MTTRRAPDSYTPLRGRVPRSGAHNLSARAVCLFSGGLDSYIGAVDLLEIEGDQVGMDLDVTLPHRFTTKGEMLAGCSNPRLVEPGLTATMSCAHPGAARFAGMSPNVHCGYCVPCLIRRAAASFGVSDPTVYATEKLSRPLPGVRGSDLRAMRMASDRYEKDPPTLADVLVPGPLPGSDKELAAYLTCSAADSMR